MSIDMSEQPGMRNECHGQELSIVESLPVIMGILRRRLVEYRTLSQITYGSVLEFEVPNMGPFQYLDLYNSRIRVVGQIVQDDHAETPLPPDPRPTTTGTSRTRRDDSEDMEVDTDEDGDEEPDAHATGGEGGGGANKPTFVGICNLPLQAIFSRVDLTLQGQPTESNSQYYPYKAYINSLETMKFRDMSKTAELFHLDDGGAFDTFDDSNIGFKVRRKHFARSKPVELIGRLACDFAQQQKLLINNVPVRLKLTPSRSEFVLLAKEQRPGYKFKILECTFQVMTCDMDPSVIVGHAAALQHKPAEYTYNESLISIFVIPAGVHRKEFENLFPSEAPSECTVGLLSSAAFNGTLSRNPFNFANMNCRNVDMSLDGQSVLPGPFTPDYEKRLYLESFLSFYNRGQLKREAYRDGFALYKFKLGELNTNDSVAPPMSGHIRLLVGLGEALDEAVVVLVFGKRPTVLKIDANRNVTR